MTETATTASAIAEAIAGFAQASSLDAFLRQQVGADRADQILTFINATNQQEAALRAAKDAGTTTATWLGRQATTLGPLPEATTAFLAEAAPAVTGASVRATGQRILEGTVAAMGLGAEALGATADDQLAIEGV